MTLPTEGPADFEIHQHSLTAVKHAFQITIAEGNSTSFFTYLQFLLL